MTYGVVAGVPAPVEMYDAVHAEVAHRVGTSVDGLLVHLARPTSTSRGFQVIEVWESKEHFNRCNRELIGPIVAQLSGGQAPPPGEQVTEEFEVRGLVIPRGGVFQ